MSETQPTLTGMPPEDVPEDVPYCRHRLSANPHEDSTTYDLGAGVVLIVPAAASAHYADRIDHCSAAGCDNPAAEDGSDPLCIECRVATDDAPTPEYEDRLGQRPSCQRPSCQRPSCQRPSCQRPSCRSYEAFWVRLLREYEQVIHELHPGHPRAIDAL